MPIIYSKYITLKNGKKIYAKDYGLQAFPIDVSEKEYKEYMQNND